MGRPKEALEYNDSVYNYSTLRSGMIQVQSKL